MKGRLWGNFSSLIRVTHRVGRSEGGLEQNLSILPTFMYIFIFPFWLDTSIFFVLYSTQAYHDYLFSLIFLQLFISYKGLYFYTRFLSSFSHHFLSQRTCIEGRNVLYTRLEFFYHFFTFFGLGLIWFGRLIDDG